MADESEHYNLLAIRDLLLAACDAEELQELFYFSENPDLREVVNQFVVPGDSLPAMVRKAVRYCESRLLLTGLLAEVERRNPRQYERFEPGLRRRESSRPSQDTLAKQAEREAQARAARLERESQEREAAERRQAQLEELYRQATTLLEARDWAGALDLLGQIEEIEPGYRDASQLLHQAQVGQARAEQIAGLMAQGMGHLEEGKWWLATQAFRQVLTVAPDHPEAMARLADSECQEQIASRLVAGQNHFRAGRWSEAISNLEAVLEIEPAHPEATTLLAEAQAQERARLEEEARLAEQARAARLKEEVLQAELERLYDEACAAAQKRDWPKATRSYGAVLKMDPNYRDAADRLAQARTLRDQENRQQWAEWGLKTSGEQPDGSTPGIDDVFQSLFGQAATGERTQQRSAGKPAATARPVTRQTVIELRGHADKVHRAAFSADGKRVVTASEDKTAQVWEAATGKLLAELRGHEQRVNSAAFSPDGMLVVTACDDGRARLWEAATGNMVAETKKHGTFLGMGWVPVVSAAFIPDGNLVATTASDGKVRMWDVVSGKFKGELEGRDAFAMRAFCSPGGQWLLAEHKDGWGRIPRDIQTRKLLDALGDRAELLKDPAFSADSKRAVTAHDDGVARVWTVATGNLVRVLNVSRGKPVRAVAFHPNGRWVATADGSENVQVWEVASGKVVTDLRGHSDIVNSVAFSPDGKWAVTASDDGTARVWEVPSE